MENKPIPRDKYIRSWNGYIDGLYDLTWSPLNQHDKVKFHADALKAIALENADALHAGEEAEKVAS